MVIIDWIILVAYLVLSLLIGLYLSTKNQDQDDYFVAGRSLSGWLAGASMAATTFSIDTPLYVAGIIGTRGLAGNWEWWSFGLAHVAMTVIFAPLWRRSGVITDAAFTELRYGGVPAAWLRAIKAFLLAVPVNCIGIGYAFLAMRKVAEALQIVDGRYLYGFISDTFILLLLVASFMLIYTVLGGLWAVVVNDLVQLALALIGAVVVAYVGLDAAGGMSELLSKLKDIGYSESLSLFPWIWTQEGFRWLDQTGISISTFTAFFFLQWWSFRRSDGGGEFIQRLLSTRDEQQAKLAGWFFLIINYFVRTWLWIVVGLSALVLLPNEQDWELSYPKLAVEYLPPFVLGIVIVSLIAAFMSTVSTSVNWGASYVTHDLYQRFFRPKAGPKELLFVGQFASIFLLLIGVFTALISDNIGSVFRLVIAIGTGPGVVLVLRWFWWRINAFTELAAMLGGFVIGASTSLVPLFRIEDYGIRLLVTTFFTALIWIGTLIFTSSESDEILNNFVYQVRPPGPGWSAIRNRIGVKSDESLASMLCRFLLSVGVLFGGFLGIGAFFLHQERGGWFGITVGIICLFTLLRKPYLKRQNY